MPRAAAAATSAASAGRAAVPRVRLRLTRRGRIVITALLAAPLLLGGLLLAPAGLAAADSGSAAASFQRVTVQPGQSLWTIAQRVAPHADPRYVVSAIEDLNGLQGAVVTPGESLALPPQYASGR